MQTNWEIFRKYYSELFGVSLELVDILAVYDVLRMCACGYANYRISKKTKLDIFYIEETLLTYYDFYGWNFDLDFSPIALYNRSNDNINRFEEEIRMTSNRVDEGFIKRMFEISQRFTKIKGEVEEFYGRN
jgi:hypothetical protein